MSHTTFYKFLNRYKEQGENALNGLIPCNLRRRKQPGSWIKRPANTGPVHAPQPGYLMSQDGKLIGRLAGIGKVYVQVVVDCASSYGWARLYTDKTAESAADFLDYVHRNYQSMDVKLRRALTDNGKEYGSSKPTYDHYYGATCLILGVKHKTTKVKHPWTNGYTERFIQTLYQEFFQVALRCKRYFSVEELQSDLNKFLLYYNWERPHQGRRTRGRTPAQAFFVPYTDQLLLPAPKLVA